MPGIKAKVTIQIIKIEQPEEVFVQVEIDCPVCGALGFVMPGHHLGSLRDAIIEAMDLYPKLTKAGTITDREGFTFRGTPHDPTTN